jgi:hypothetical protein
MVSKNFTCQELALNPVGQSSLTVQTAAIKYRETSKVNRNYDNDMYEKETDFIYTIYDYHDFYLLISTQTGGYNKQIEFSIQL